MAAKAPDPEAIPAFLSLRQLVAFDSEHLQGLRAEFAAMQDIDHIDDHDHEQRRMNEPGERRQGEEIGAKPAVEGIITLSKVMMP